MLVTIAGCANPTFELRLALGELDSANGELKLMTEAVLAEAFFLAGEPCSRGDGSGWSHWLRTASNLQNIMNTMLIWLTVAIEAGAGAPRWRA